MKLATVIAGITLCVGVMIQPGCQSASQSPAGSGGAAGEASGGSGGTTPTGGAPGTGGTSGTGGPGTGGVSGGTGGTEADAGPQGGSSGAGDAAAASDTGASSADTWDSYAKGFFATYCVSCHNDDNKGDASRDYHVLGNVMKEKSAIACGLSKNQTDWSKRGCSGSPPAHQFPVGNGAHPTDTDRDRLIRWIDAGSP